MPVEVPVGLAPYENQTRTSKQIQKSEEVLNTNQPNPNILNPKTLNPKP